MEYDIINEREALNRLGDKEFLAELLQDFEQMPELDMELLAESIANSDFQSVEHIAHTLKGASGNLALTAIYKVSTALDDAAKQQNTDLISKHLAALKHEVERFRARLPEYLDSLKN